MKDWFTNYTSFLVSQSALHTTLQPDTQAFEEYTRNPTSAPITPPVVGVPDGSNQLLGDTSSSSNNSSTMPTTDWENVLLLYGDSGGADYGFDQLFAESNIAL